MYAIEAIHGEIFIKVKGKCFFIFSTVISFLFQILNQGNLRLLIVNHITFKSLKL